MASRRIAPPWDFLHEASNPSLESFELSRLNHTANLRKEIAALLEQWIAEAAEALLARWVREDRKLLPHPGEPLDILCADRTSLLSAGRHRRSPAPPGAPFALAAPAASCLSPRRSYSIATVLILFLELRFNLMA